jgi:3-oxoacyl-[acyl-carrier protein] reductase
MISQGFGRIVTITSVHARLAQPGCLAYDVSKAGLEAATRSAALDLAPHGILVNAVAPGFVRTAMSTLPDGTDETESPEFAAVYLSGRKLPIGRGATPEEIAPAVELLAGHENTYITGQVLTVDGGLTMTF